MKRTFILLGVFGSLIGLPDARGQSIAPAALNSSGGTATVSGNIYDWSVGEMAMVSTFTSGSVIVTQGLLQTDLSTASVSSISSSAHLQVYPNPANSLLNIKLTAASAGKISYRLLDMTGNEIQAHQQDVPQGTTILQLDINSIAAATYMLEVYVAASGNNGETISFKIEKLK